MQVAGGAESKESGLLVGLVGLLARARRERGSRESGLRLARMLVLVTVGARESEGRQSRDR
jgi:hypothetical protein